MPVTAHFTSTTVEFITNRKFPLQTCLRLYSTPVFRSLIVEQKKSGINTEGYLISYILTPLKIKTKAIKGEKILKRKNRETKDKWNKLSFLFLILFLLILVSKQNCTFPFKVHIIVFFTKLNELFNILTFNIPSLKRDRARAGKLFLL